MMHFTCYHSDFHPTLYPLKGEGIILAKANVLNAVKIKIKKTASALQSLESKSMC